MKYMMNFNKEEDIVWYWDEPTISLDYSEHRFHQILKNNWRENKISNIGVAWSGNENYKFDKNWHLIATGLLFIVFLIGFQAILLTIVDSSGSAWQVASDNRMNSLNSKIANKISLANVKGN